MRWGRRRAYRVVECTESCNGTGTLVRWDLIERFGQQFGSKEELSL